MTEREREDVLKRLCGYYSDIAKRLKVIGIDENDIEDVAMEVFIDAYRGLDGLREPDKLLPWLQRIAENRSCAYFRKRARRREIYAMAKADENEYDPLETVADDVSPEQVICDAEQVETVKRMLAALPELNRRVLYMRFWGGYRFAEIARILGLNENTVRSIFKRSMERLRNGCVMIGEGGDSHD